MPAFYFGKNFRKTILKEFLGYEGVKGGLGYQAEPKTQWGAVNLVCKVITSKDRLRYR